MIESEEKRKEIIESVEHWAKWTRVETLLRPGDAYTLSDTILQLFYKVVLTCGHMVKTIDEGVYLRVDDGEEGWYEGLYCQHCAQRMIEEGYAHQIDNLSNT